MKRWLVFLLVISLLICGFSGCGVAGGPAAKETRVPSEPLIRVPGDSDVSFLTAEEFHSDRVAGEVSLSFRTSYADFALKLLKASKDQSGRLVSPLSVMTALQMVANGAKQETLRQFEQLLGGGMDTETLNRELFNYYQSLANSTQPNARFEAANAVWMTNDANFEVAQDFVRTISNTFDAQLAQASFADPKTIDAINDWCDRHTDGMIPKILEYGDVTEETIMVLLNAILFDALWAQGYESYQCREATFTTEQGAKKTVTMMRNDESRYIKGKNETGFLKRYQGGFGFVALLPNQGMSLENYLKTLDGARFTELMDGMQYRTVEASMPKFSFDWSDSLVDTLKALGLEECFDPLYSDLSGLGVYNPPRSFSISDVIHKTHIEVDESGTLAAAVTAVAVKGSAAPETHPQVILDRPFVYAIVDMTTLLPVFIGTVTNPS